MIGGPRNIRSGAAPLTDRIGTRRLALGVSIALHMAVLYAASRIAWNIPDFDSEPPRPVLWIDAPPIPRPHEPLLDEIAPPLRALRPEPRPATVSETTEREDPEEPIDETRSVDPSADAVEPDGGGVRIIRREIDWDAERERIVAEALEELRRSQGDRDFSTAERATERAAAEAAELTERLFEKCPVVTGRFARLAMRMTGRCFRTEPHRDLFAQFKPEYLKKMPVCEQVELAGSAMAEGVDTPVRIQKCRLVPIEEFEVPRYMAR